MTYVYKGLPGGGYTAMPAQTPKDVARFVAQGWSETAPVATPTEQTAVEDVPIAPADGAEPPKRRGRRPSVN